MANGEKKMAFSGRMKEYFGLKPGQTVVQFAQELKELTPESKNEFCDMLNAAGFPTEKPAVKPGS